MSSIGQHLQLVSNGNGDAVGSGQWFGGKGIVYAWAGSVFNTKIDVSPDGGTTWFQVADIGSGTTAVLNAPALMVRARGMGPSSPQGFNVVVIGHDAAE